MLGDKYNGEIQGRGGEGECGGYNLKKGVRGCALNFGMHCSDLTSGPKDLIPQLLKRTPSFKVMTPSWEGLHPLTDLCKSVSAYTSSSNSEQIG